MRISRPPSILPQMFDTLFPADCAMCGQRGTWVCDLCRKIITPLLPALCCDRCGHPVINNRCACFSMHPVIVRARAMSTYDGWVGATIRKIKYDYESSRVAALRDGMIEASKLLDPMDVLIPVPLHSNRERERGFNQSARIALVLGNAMNIPVEHGLIRTRDTAHQATSGREDRLANVEGAFDLTPGWKPSQQKHYVLVDDVYTTGATISACAEVLDSIGLQHVSLLTVAFDLVPRDLELYKHLVRITGP